MNARGLRYIAASRPCQQSLARDPETALRIVATKEGSLQATTIRLQQGLIEEEARRGRIRLRVDAHTLAYAVVRLSESFLHADLVAGEGPDRRERWRCCGSCSDDRALELAPSRRRR